LEAWSRGAVGGTFVERDRHALAAIQINLAAVARSLGGDPAACAIAPADALTWTDASGRPARIIFVDPPYAGIGAQAKRLFAQIERLLDSSAEATVVFEMPGDLELNPAGWRCLRRLGGGGPAAASACLFRRQRP
jgi:16S rRNA (guanine966-N2)-methyltransferase